MADPICAGYGDAVIADTTNRLTEDYRAGFCIANLNRVRPFNLAYSDRRASIHYPLGSELGSRDEASPISYPLGSQLPSGLSPNLGWSHDRAGMRTFDLKISELTHQDIGQMDGYVRTYENQGDY